MSLKNIAVRAASGAVYVALIVCSIIFGGNWAFPCLCCLFTFIGIVEFQKMSQDDFYGSPRTLFVDLLIGLSLPAFVALRSCGVDPLAIAVLFVMLAFCMMRLVMELYCKRKNPVRHIALSIMSITYVAIPLSLATSLYFFDSGLLLLMFVMIWLNDTGAFLVGSAIGSHRLFERLSPKKSWEGFFGGLGVCVAAGYIAASWFPDHFAAYSGNMLACIGVLVSVMSTWGDLFESMIKRTYGVKDSGNLIPGHGGMLDRIDSLLFVAPALLIFVSLLFVFMNTTIIHGA